MHNNHDLGMTLTEEDLAFLGEFRLKEQLRSLPGSPIGIGKRAGIERHVPALPHLQPRERDVNL
jgi:hypothetical protein